MSERIDQSFSDRRFRIQRRVLADGIAFDESRDRSGIADNKAVGLLKQSHRRTFE